VLKQRLQVQCCTDVCEGHPRSLEMTTFDTMHMSSYWSSIAMTVISLSAPPAAAKAFWVHFEPQNIIVSGSNDFGSFFLLSNISMEAKKATHGTIS